MEETTLQTLPAELRNRIYELALVKDERIEVKLYFDRTRTDKVISRIANYPSLLQTCRQIREEASPIFYGQNVFEIGRCGDYANIAQLARWLGKLSPSDVTLLRDVRIGAWPKRKHRVDRLMQYLAMKHVSIDRTVLRLDVSGSATDPNGTDAQSVPLETVPAEDDWESWEDDDEQSVKGSFAWEEMGAQLGAPISRRQRRVNAEREQLMAAEAQAERKAREKEEARMARQAASGRPRPKARPVKQESADVPEEDAAYH